LPYRKIAWLTDSVIGVIGAIYRPVIGAICGRLLLFLVVIGVFGLS